MKAIYLDGGRRLERAADLGLHAGGRVGLSHAGYLPVRGMMRRGGRTCGDVQLREYKTRRERAEAARHRRWSRRALDSRLALARCPMPASHPSPLTRAQPSTTRSASPPPPVPLDPPSLASSFELPPSGVLRLGLASPEVHTPHPFLAQPREPLRLTSFHLAASRRPQHRLLLASLSLPRRTLAQHANAHEGAPLCLRACFVAST